MKIIVSLVCFVTLLGVEAVFAGEEEFGKEQMEKWGAFYEARAKNYEIRLADASQERLSLSPQPVMRWMNPVIDVGNTHGQCFVWTREGRPEVFVSLFLYTASSASNQEERVVAHAFNSLSREPLVASFDGSVFWAPHRSGVVEMQPIPEAPPAAKSRPARLTQMRQLARQFTATSGGTDGNEELRLRLLTTPAFRYEKESEEALDGALFAFVTGTDPEVLLLIEATKLDSQTTWQFLPARHSHLTLNVLHNDINVWGYMQNDPEAQALGTRHTYCSQHGIDRQPRILE